MICVFSFFYLTGEGEGGGKFISSKVVMMITTGDLLGCKGPFAPSMKV